MRFLVAGVVLMGRFVQQAEVFGARGNPGVLPRAAGQASGARVALPWRHQWRLRMAT
jgi:hypothetical protein